jgi:hypothetical protein
MSNPDVPDDWFAGSSSKQNEWHRGYAIDWEAASEIFGAILLLLSPFLILGLISTVIYLVSLA